jgi:hypothetical protein
MPDKKNQAGHTIHAQKLSRLINFLNIVGIFRNPPQQVLEDRV